MDASAATFAELKRLLTDRGATLVACADLRPVPAKLREGLPRGVCIGVALKPSVVAEIADGPTEAYEVEYERVNPLLDRLGQQCAAFLRERGFHAVPRKPTVGTPDKETLSTALPHKTVATRAGVGWIGKCALLITETYGSAVRLNTVLTDAPLPVGTPVEASRCGDCTACMDACPAGAPTGRDWQLGEQRSHLFDAFACYEAVRKQIRNKGLHHIICGICIAACPYTDRYLADNGCLPE